jgi:prevent-host-death family protein
MKEVPFTQFRRNASIMLERVRRTRKPILVTNSDEPLAVIVPVAIPKKKKGRPSGSDR